MTLVEVSQHAFLVFFITSGSYLFNMLVFFFAMYSWCNISKCNFLLNKPVLSPESWVLSPGNAMSSKHSPTDGTKPYPEPVLTNHLWDHSSMGNVTRNDQNLYILTHWGQDKMAAISQTILSNAFPWMKMLKFRLKFHWILFLRVQLTIFQHWFR